MKRHCFHENNRIVIMVVSVILILVVTIANAAMFTQPISEFIEGQGTFSNMTPKIASAYLSDGFWQKTSFIDLNGLFERLTAQREVNGVYRLNNGMLTNKDYVEKKRWAFEEPAAGITALASMLNTQGIPFLFVMRPVKMDINEELLPAGLTDYKSENEEKMLSLLAQGGVDTLDLRPELTGSVEQVGRYFYRTDHHWNADGAFVAFQMIMRRLHEKNPSIQPAYTDASLWERHSLDNWFLGSDGKRVGQFYAGVDPLVWYTPRFPTRMSCINDKYRTVYKGDYIRANLVRIILRNLITIDKVLTASILAVNILW